MTISYLRTLLSKQVNRKKRVSKFPNWKRRKAQLWNRAGAKDWKEEESKNGDNSLKGPIWTCGRHWRPHIWTCQGTSVCQVIECYMHWMRTILIRNQNSHLVEAIAWITSPWMISLQRGEWRRCWRESASCEAMWKLEKWEERQQGCFSRTTWPMWKPGEQGDCLATWKGSCWCRCKSCRCCLGWDRKQMNISVGLMFDSFGHYWWCPHSQILWPTVYLLRRQFWWLPKLRNQC